MNTAEIKNAKKCYISRDAWSRLYLSLLVLDLTLEQSNES